MKIKDERIGVRLPAEMKERIKAVAERYDMSMSDALLFLLDCGLDDERNYRPAYVITSKIMRFSEKIVDKIKESGNSEEVKE